MILQYKYIALRRKVRYPGFSPDILKRSRQMPMLRTLYRIYFTPKGRPCQVELHKNIGSPPQPPAKKFTQWILIFFYR